MSKTKVIILSIPYTEPLPMVAPVLLSACLTNVGISAKGIDLSIKFFDEFNHKPYWSALKYLFTIGKETKLSRRAIIDLLKFIRRQLKLIQTEHDPEYLGLSIFTSESIDFSYLLIPYIRRYLPKTKIILGGRGLELTCGVYNIKYYEKYHKYGMADIIVVGDAETAIIEAIQNNHSGIYFSKQQTKEDLDLIPSPNWDDYDMSVYSKYHDNPIVKDENRPDIDSRYIAMSGSKGCIRQCTFCDVQFFWPKYIYREGANIARDIIQNYTATGIKNFYFTDNLINGSTSQYRTLNEVLAREIPNTINYSGYAIFRSKQYMPESDFELAKVAGCKEWSIGVESGSETVRFELKKNFTDDDMDHSIRHLSKNNITQTWLLMVGYPTETEQDYLATEELLRRYAHLNDSIKLGITATFQLLSDSPLLMNTEYVKKYGLNYDFSSNLSRYFWTADINPENTFDVRTDRFLRLVELSRQLGYTFSQWMPVGKWVEELTHLKKLYENYKPKKIFVISSN